MSSRRCSSFKKPLPIGMNLIHLSPISCSLLSNWTVFILKATFAKFTDGLKDSPCVRLVAVG